MNVSYMPLLRHWLLRLSVFAGLVAFYLLTAPLNHATSLDAYGFAYWITDIPVSEIPELRVFLWLAANHLIYGAASLLAPDLDPFMFFGIFHAIQTALTVILLERMLAIRFGVSGVAAWVSALGFAFSYGVWRYATEMEIYASVALITVAVLHLAFSFEAERIYRPTTRLISLAVCGGLGTLCYQPIGIVAGLAVPIYLVTRIPLARLIGYFAALGTVVFGGLFTVNFLTEIGGGEFGLQSLFDTDGKPVVIPGFAELAQSLVAFLQNILSLNWSFAFDPTRTIYEQYTGPHYNVWLHPAQFAKSSYQVFFVTLPAAAVLAIVSVVVARKAPSRIPFSAMELAILALLAGNVAMILLIDPIGLEPWIPSLLPLFILAGIRLVHPLMAAGGAGIGTGLIAVFLVHNWFAGIKVFAFPDSDYWQHQTDSVLSAVGPSDLLVVGDNWLLHRFLLFKADAPSIGLYEMGARPAQSLIGETLERGGSVVFFDDLAQFHGDEVQLHPQFGGNIPARYLQFAERIPLGDDGHAVRLSPKRNN